MSTFDDRLWPELSSCLPVLVDRMGLPAVKVNFLQSSLQFLKLIWTLTSWFLKLKAMWKCLFMKELVIDNVH